MLVECAEKTTYRRRVSSLAARATSRGKRKNEEYERESVKCRQVRCLVVAVQTSNTQNQTTDISKSETFQMAEWWIKDQNTVSDVQFIRIQYKREEKYFFSQCSCVFELFTNLSTVCVLPPSGYFSTVAIHLKREHFQL